MLVTKHKIIDNFLSKMLVRSIKNKVNKQIGQELRDKLLVPPPENNNINKIKTDSYVVDERGANKEVSASHASEAYQTAQSNAEKDDNNSNHKESPLLKL